MVHISPIAASDGPMAAAGKLLPAGASLVLFGPDRAAGAETVESNLAFDTSLKARNPAWSLCKA